MSKLHEIRPKTFGASVPESVDLFRLMFEEAPYGLGIGGPDHRILKVNRAFCQMMGYDQSEVIGKTFYDFTHPDDIAKTEVFRTNIKYGRSPIQYTKRLVRKDGETVLVKISNHATYESGKLLYSFGIAENVTDEKSELEFLRAQLAAIVEFSSDGIYSVSLNGIIETWNQGAEKIYGYSAREVMGRSASVLMPDVIALGDQFTHAVSEAKAGKSTRGLETMHKSKDGKVFPISLTVSPIENQFSQVVGVSLIARDMTAYREALVALHESEQQMRNASEGLARTNKELEQFAFVASHDLQEPLRTISCFLQLLERKHKGRLDQDADEYIEFAVQGAKRMQRLILDLLQFSRSTRLTQELEPVMLSETVEEAIFNLRGLIDANQVTINYSSLPTVLSCQQQLVQVFQNLFSNAIKFRSREIPVIHVDAKKADGKWVVTVKDNGIGFNSEHADRIFLIFQRLHTKEKYPGTGVGLAICKKIIESHGGRIWAESSVGQGAVFSFTLLEPHAAAEEIGK